MSTITSFRIDSPNVVYETFENEVVVVHFESGNYYSLEKTGADIWASIAERLTVTEIVQVLSRRYTDVPPDVEKTVSQFIDELHQEQLVIAAGDEAPADLKGDEASPAPRVESEPSNFEPPILQRYTDMQDMLLLDPIHEVDETGWPAARPDQLNVDE